VQRDAVILQSEHLRGGDGISKVKKRLVGTQVFASIFDI
jgi:hypothetical protein